MDADAVNDATAFLETFFKLYPTATDKELTYYVEGNALELKNGDYLYSKLVNPVFTDDGDNVKMSITVKFTDNQTKATLISQYYQSLHKDNNWKIIGKGLRCAFLIRFTCSPSFFHYFSKIY